MTEAEEEVQIISKPKERLKFIDMARSIAILLMLEGHFIEQLYRDFKPMVALHKQNGTSGSLVFDIWYGIKGFTAPMFFTVTGLVFVYLLARNKDAGFFRNPRVKKGFRRALELIFWGYLLQVNLRNFDRYVHGHFGSWLFAFHVLQSIGVGIACLILLYGLYTRIKVIPLFVYYFLAGTLIFCFYPYLHSLPKTVYVPAGYPEIIQNLIKGPDSLFAIVPWMAFTMYGGMIGALLLHFKKYVKQIWFPAMFILLGLTFIYYGRIIFLLLDDLLKMISLGDIHYVENAWLYGRLGQVLIVLGILMYVDKYFHVKEGLFLKIGQNTLPIYIIHVIILYGGIFGFGLNSADIVHTLSGWQSIGGAVLFITFFVVFIKYFEWFNGLKIKLIQFLRLKKKPQA